MSHKTIRANIIPEVIKLICKNCNYTENEALDKFYKSATCASLADDETGLYGQSALYIYGLFLDEINETDKKNSGKTAVFIMFENLQVLIYKIFIYYLICREFL